MGYNPLLYPRTISVLRPNSQLPTQGGAGLGQPSQMGSAGTSWGSSSKVAATGAGETQVQASIPCSIQGTSGRATGGGEVPSDAPGPSRWQVYIPQGAVPKGTIKREDIIVDDESNRYQVSSPYWHGLGWKIECVLLDN